MSGVVKGVKKIFKKVVKVVKKIIKPLAIAAAVYFTAGVAMSYFGPTQAFASTLPGFASAAGPGTGIFSTAATKLGIGGGLQAGAAGLETAGTVAAGGGSFFGGGGAAAAPGSTGAGGAFFGGSAGSTVAPVATKGLIGKAAASFGSMSLADKLIMTKVGADIGGALFGPSEQEIAEMEAVEQAKFRGAYYGMDASGGVAPAPEPEAQPQQAQVAQKGPVMPTSPEQQQLDEGRAKKDSLFPTAESVPQTSNVTGPGTMKQQIPIPSSISSPAPDVRYING